MSLVWSLEILLPQTTLLLVLTSDDVHADPVRRGVGWHAGVVPAVAGGGVGDGEPSLRRVYTV